MTTKDAIGNRAFGDYDDLTDPKSIRIFTGNGKSEVRVESPEGLFVVDCPGCGDALPALSFFSVDKVTADCNLPCRTCRREYEIGDCKLRLVQQ